MITIQFLEPGPHISKVTPQVVREKIRTACEILPVDSLLLGWDLPETILQICREETEQAGVKLFRWHPLLTGNDQLQPKLEWRTENFTGEKISGFRNLDEFTFICPNQPLVREEVLNHLQNICVSGVFDGVFLDRMRFPSPVENPGNSFACFCPYCCESAHRFGLDLNSVRHNLFASTPEQIIFTMLSGASLESPLAKFLDFRLHTITDFLAACISILRSANLEIGLDCFTPSLTRMVGQDLSVLSPMADWTKLMIYGHAIGPATLPFEFGALVRWLLENTKFNEAQALVLLEEAMEFPLPKSMKSLKGEGFDSVFLVSEYQRARKSTPAPNLLVGIELVEMPGVSELRLEQIEKDLVALKSANADGLSISWDLWHIPLDRLELVRKIWF